MSIVDIDRRDGKDDEPAPVEDADERDEMMREPLRPATKDALRAAGALARRVRAAVARCILLFMGSVYVSVCAREWCMKYESNAGGERHVAKFS